MALGFYISMAVCKAISTILEKVVSRSSEVVFALETKESEIVKIANARTLNLAAIVYNPAVSISTQSTPNSAHFLKELYCFVQELSL